MWTYVNSTRETVFRNLADGSVESTFAHLLPEYEEIAEPAAPPAVVPASVTRRQAMRAMLEKGVLDDVEALIAQAPRSLQIDWQAERFERESPAVAAVAAELEWSGEFVDALFVAAEAVR